MPVPVSPSVPAIVAPAPKASAARGAADGFVLGMNLPWVQYGEFGANAWQPQGGLSRPENLQKLDAMLDDLKARGITHVRWWLLADGRAGVKFAPDGTPAGLDSALFKDMDAAVAALRARGMTATFAVVDFGWAKKATTLKGVTMGGHADVIKDPAKLQAYLDRVLKPILQRYGQEKAIEAWDLINEPEWETFGAGSANPFDISQKEMRRFVTRGAEYVHRYTDQQVTVGSASTRWLPLVKGTGLDFYQPHWYDHFERIAPLGRDLAKLKVDRPVILGEYPTKGSNRTPGQILDTVQKAGYRGAMGWAVNAQDKSSGWTQGKDGVTAWAQQHAGQLNRDRFERSR